MNEIIASQTTLALGFVNVTTTSAAELLAKLDSLTTDDARRHFVCFCESNLFVHAHEDSRVAEALRGATMVLPDGISLTIAAKVIAGHTVPRVPGPSFMLRACEEGIARGWRHFFMGGGAAEPLTKVRQWRMFETGTIRGTSSWRRRPSRTAPGGA